MLATISIGDINKVLKIATRNSPLALWQAEFVKSRLQFFYPDLEVELVKMTTQGDKILNTPLSKIGGKNLFIKELEVGMLEGRADIAVHSMKDVPYELPTEFEVGAILERENPFDAFVSNDFDNISELPQGSRVGSCSLRRIVQLKALRPDLVILDLRGNVNTRLRKLDNGEEIEWTCFWDYNGWYDSSGVNIPNVLKWEDKIVEHPSETALDNHNFDYVIDNNGSIEELIEKVKSLNLV